MQISAGLSQHSVTPPAPPLLLYIAIHFKYKMDRFCFPLQNKVKQHEYYLSFRPFSLDKLHRLAIIAVV